MSGFSAGTLVHTKDGLRPIEKIEAGDLVLSKQENEKGKCEYKRVTRTFMDKDIQVIMMACGGRQRDGTDRYHDFAVTPDHRIWVQSKGWKPAEKIKWRFPALKVELLADENSDIVSNSKIYRTDDPNIGWIPAADTINMRQDLGSQWDIPAMQRLPGSVGIGIQSVERTGQVKPEHYFRTTVCNIEVEDFHTYYVGEVGVWVHDTTIGTAQ